MMDSIDLAGLRREYETQGLGRADLHHVYLEGAKGLRDDLPE